MIRFDLISAVPSLLSGPLDHSIVQRAKDKNLVEVYVHDLRDYTKDKHKKVDDYPYGGDPGMVLTPQPIFDCISLLCKSRRYDEIIFTAPDGKAFTQKEANHLSLKKNIIILCGHYKGIDHRIREHIITQEYSIGDVVLSGGELPAMMIVDAIVRLLPGAIGDAGSALSDSFQDDLLEAPVYTRPATFNGWDVPEVLRSGDFKKIKEWQDEQAYARTKDRRKDLLKDDKKDY